MNLLESAEANIPFGGVKQPGARRPPIRFETRAVIN